VDRHVRITYAVKLSGTEPPAGLSFDYRIKATAAGLFEQKFQDWLPGATVTVDDYVTDELPVIPCAELWEP
jgi:hypothetical protein